MVNLGGYPVEDNLYLSLPGDDRLSGSPRLRKCVIEEGRGVCLLAGALDSGSSKVRSSVFAGSNPVLPSGPRAPPSHLITDGSRAQDTGVDTIKSRAGNSGRGFHSGTPDHHVTVRGRVLGHPGAQAHWIVERFVDNGTSNRVFYWALGGVAICVGLILLQVVPG